MKIEITDLAAEMRDEGIPSATVNAVIKRLEAAAKQEKDSRPPKVTSKKQWVILVADKDGSLKNVEVVGWALQLNEEAPPQCAIDRIHAAANSYNDSRKGRKRPVKTVGETCEVVGGKHWKSANPTEKTSVKTKTPVVIQFVSNDLKTS